MTELLGWLNEQFPRSFTAEGNGWHLTTHWAMVANRLTLVGLDIRSFPGDQPGEGEALAEVTQRILRSILISRVREQARVELLRDQPVMPVAWQRSAEDLK